MAQQTPKNKDAQDAIKKETSRIKKLYKDLPENRKKLAEKLIERAAFMLVSLATQAELNLFSTVLTTVPG